MITKYEKKTIEMKDHIEVESLTLVEKQLDADYIHYCGHDTIPPTPCKRIKIK
jgi:hypothetical protein